MGMLQTNEVPFNPSVNPDWETKTALVARTPELPEEQGLVLLKDSAGNLFLGHDSRLYTVLRYFESAIAVTIVGKDCVTGEERGFRIREKNTKARLADEYRVLTKA